MSLLVDLQVFPCIDYFKNLEMQKYVEIEVCERFEKSSFRNRYIISGPNGLSNLTVPIKGGREQKVTVTAVQIDNSVDWRTKHWRNITSSYAKAPFFDFYAPAIYDALNNPEKSLFNFSITILDRLLNLLNINVKYTFTTSYSPCFDGLDLRNRLLPKNFQNRVEGWRPRYPQVFEDRHCFQPNLSILDLLFCVGPRSADLLKASVAGGL